MHTDLNTMDDWQLVDAFVRENSEPAFRQLVERHAGLVRAVALRQTGDAPSADDVAQAVFILLARKAPALRRTTILSGWLFQTTRFVARRAQRSAERRRRREEEAFDMQQLTLDDQATWRRLAPIIDDSLSRLRAVDRDVLLLRFVEGRSLREVSLALGVSEDAAKKRVTRATEKLRDILRRTDVSVSAAALSAVLASQFSAAQASVGVANLSAIWAAAALAPASVGPAATLAADAWRAWQWMKAATLTTATVAAGIVAFISIHVARPSHPTAGIPTTSLTNNIVVPSLATANNFPADDPSLRLLRFQVIDAASGRGLPRATVLSTMWKGGQTETRTNGVTDDEGFCDVRFWPGSGRLDVGAFISGWAARYATWPSEGSSQIPMAYTLALSKVNQTMGGEIRNPEGEPVPNVEVWFTGHAATDYAQRERPRERFGFIVALMATRTGPDGRWSLAFIPLDHPGFQLEARHPDYVETPIVSSGPAASGATPASDSQLRDVWTGRLITTLRTPMTLAGLVQDERGVPIRGAHIQRRDAPPIFTTDARGRFNVPRLPEGEWPFTVTADGYAPVRTNAVIRATRPETTSESLTVITLRTGAVLRLRVIDQVSADVPDAEVGLERWGQYRSTFAWRDHTDINGQLLWPSAPSDADIELFARKPGYCMTRDVVVRADGEEKTIVLHPTLDVYGRVVDAITGQGIRDFKAVPGYGDGSRYYDSSMRWHSGSTVRGTNGMFKLTFDEKIYPWQVRVSATGYHDWVSAPLTGQVQMVLDVPMKPATVEESVRGIVLEPNGAPAIGAQVALLTFEHNVELKNQSFQGTAPWVVRTGSRGEFQFPASSIAHSVAAVSRVGFVQRRIHSTAEPIELSLAPWGKVEGRIDKDATLFGVEEVKLYDPAADNYQGRVSLLGSYSLAPTRTSDLAYPFTFTFDSVPAGAYNVFINSRSGVPYHHGTPVTVRAGETASVVITESFGTRVIGRLIAPAGQTIAWSNDLIVAQFQAQGLEKTAASVLINAQASADKRRRELEFWTSDEGRESVNHPTVFSALVRPDGTFATTDRLPAGTYRLAVVVHGGSVSRIVSVDGQNGELSLGDIPLQATGK